ncbi:PQQ-dependent sugar dehydrogenase [Labrenzia sp. 011]|uniref:PQQ-dependent sugar dehydrogenase n=1 Tax=Labrenzia sp. 011 TaxID=2171494 RepID=UPI001AD9017C|nr:PQQ-dependent sugar dehydrogenase [Labrenzia sp. 011]
MTKIALLALTAGLVGALHGGHPARLPLDGNAVVAREKRLMDPGERIRDVRRGRDGFINVLTGSDNGQRIRLGP